MWLLVLTFLLVTLLVGWMLFGYFIVAWLLGLFRSPGTTPSEADDEGTGALRLAAIVPCYNERDHILKKLADLRAQDFPRDRLKVVFADGGSTDGTVELLEQHLRDDEPFEIVRCPDKGKILQLNHVLVGLDADVVCNTDVDSRLDPGTFRQLVAELAQHPDVWVVGAYCCPADDALEVERYYWASQNKGRSLESDARTASIVIAQCYAFRRELLPEFPEDVIADDIYVAFLCALRGKQSLYSRAATAVETRGPTTYNDFVVHKFRKSNAYLRECLRFIYRLPEFPLFCRLMLLTRLSQQLLLPVMGASWLLLAGVLLTMFRVDVLVLGCVILASLLLLTSMIFRSVPLPGGQVRYGTRVQIEGYVLTNLIMFLTGLTYPFCRQDSSYRKIGSVASERGV